MGCSAVGQVAVTAFFSRSITATAARFQRLTKHRLPVGSTRHRYGNAPTSFSMAAGSLGFASGFFSSGSLRPSGGLGGSPFGASFLAGGPAVVGISTRLSGLSSGTRTTQSPHGEATNSSRPAGSKLIPPTTTRCRSCGSLSCRLTSSCFTRFR